VRRDVRRWTTLAEMANIFDPMNDWSCGGAIARQCEALLILPQRIGERFSAFYL